MSNLLLDSLNLFWGMRFRTCEKFRVFADSKSSLTPEIFHKYKSHTAITSMVASSYRSRKSLRIVDSAKQNLNQNNCAKHQKQKFLLLLAFAKSRILSYLTDFNQPKKVILQNLARSAKSFCYFWLKPKVESPLSLLLRAHCRFAQSKSKNST